MDLCDLAEAQHMTHRSWLKLLRGALDVIKVRLACSIPEHDKNTSTFLA